jgi:hypothetical protein
MSSKCEKAAKWLLFYCQRLQRKVHSAASRQFEVSLDRPKTEAPDNTGRQNLFWIDFPLHNIAPALLF